MPVLHRELMDAFPDAKVVLSVRNPQTWYKSVHDSIYNFHLMRKDPAVRITGNLLGYGKNFQCVDEISCHRTKVRFYNM